MNKRVVLLGAAGQMLQVTAQVLFRHLKDHTLCLADMHSEALQKLASTLDRSKVQVVSMDLNDETSLQKLVSGAALVIHGAGPFYRTAQKVRAACLTAKVDYLDIDDDVASNQEAIQLDTQAREQGVRLLVGCGASPGITNLLALHAMTSLDEVHTLEMAWCVGNEGPQQVGRAVAAHAFHVGAGDSVTIEQGQLVVRQSMSRSTMFPLGGAAGCLRMYETAHPEPVQFGFSHPGLQQVVCWGGFDPAPINGVLKGVSIALRQGQLSEEQAFKFLHEVAAGRVGTLKGWRHALPGLWQQWQQGEMGVKSMAEMAWQALSGRQGACRSGLAARAWGIKDGHFLEVQRQAVAQDIRLPATTMAQATGTAAAVFALLALGSPLQQSGTLFPQMWVNPVQFFATLQTCGLTDVVQASEVIRPAGYAPGTACPA